MLITIGEAVAYVVSGMYGDVRELGTLPAVLIILQVRSAAVASGDAGSAFGEKGAASAAERIGCCVLATCSLAGPGVGRVVAGTLIVCCVCMPAWQLSLMNAWVVRRLERCSVVAR